ncbi:MAG: PKD domain-containing protein [Candidatus Hodarchaeota archaeon]
MRFKNKKVILFWLILVLVATSSGAVAGDVILHPGYITGSITVIDLIQGETLIGGSADAYSLTDNYDGHDYNAPGGNYFLTVEGDYNYKVFTEARTSADFQFFKYQSTVSLGRKDTHVGIGETIENFDFVLEPGRIAPIVIVSGGEIQQMTFYVKTDFELPVLKQFTATHHVEGKNVWDPDLGKYVFHYLEGDESSFPMRPRISYDANGDGDYNDYLLDESYVMVYGWVWIEDIQYYLPPQYIDVIKSVTTYVEWILDTSSSIYGSVVVQGEEISYYYINGNAVIEGTDVYFSRFISPGSEVYDVKLPPATWDLHTNAYFIGPGREFFNILTLPKKTVTIDVGERKEVSWYIEPSYVTGSVDLYGAYGNLRAVDVYGGQAGYAVARNSTNKYELILFEGNWRIGFPYTTLYFNYDASDITSDLLVTDWSIPSIFIESGTKQSGVDLSFGTATINVNYRVDLPEGEGLLKSPELIASASEGDWPNLIYSHAKGYGSDELTTLGKCTITVLEGTYNVEAYATVEDSYTKFGEFTVSVEPGDVITQDIEAPTVDVPQPGGFEHIYGSSVEVEGIASDIPGVASITVNGLEVVFESTNNPDDPEEVSFSTIVEDLEFGENVITIIVTDELGNAITVERTVFRDDLPPEIISITGPIDPVSLGANYLMTGVFTDLDIDDTHTAIWDWGDGTTTEGTVNQISDIVTGYHKYTLPGVYTVSLIVVDSYGESDTATWSQYMVIYDPSGGFVTGGGWINSPVGSYPADPELNGKANFGFVAKYKKGTIIPTGNTEFQFHAGDLNFHSDTYQWLVIAGARTKFKGVGTINGEGSYNFMLTAIDGDLINGGGFDKFRLKIWIEDETTGEEIIIYDNMLDAEDDVELDETTVIGGGSIKIHK